MCVNTILRHAKTLDWGVIPADEEDTRNFDADIELIKNFLETPNRNSATFWDVWGPYLRDILELDSGVIYLGKNEEGELSELFAHDGTRFLFDVDKHGVIKGFWQYAVTHSASTPKFFYKDEIIYGQMNLSTETFPYGFSPLQSIQQEVELMIQSTRYNKDFFKNNGIPAALVTTQMEETQQRRFMENWKKINPG